MSHFHTTTRVWLKVTNLKWVSGTVEGVNDRDLIIRTEDGQQLSVPRGSDKLSQRTPANLEAVDNLTSLPDLDEPNMLHSLCVRYKTNKIYTRTGPILVCMNPWQDLNLYSQDILKGYRRQKIDNVPPHVYAIAEAAFTNLQTDRKDQTILVSGDSGSGKTESTKFMMQYLAAVSHHTTQTTNTEQRVLQCNPVLEAFGNAKTLRNDNSSRFGKYIDINFDDNLALSGAKIDTYLLEKSRVVAQETGERNFHIFYQLCTGDGVSPALSQTLKLGGASAFNYTKVGAHVTVGYKPANSFQFTENALAQIGFQEAERTEIFKVTGAVLHMGNIKIQYDANHHAVLPITDPDAMHAASLLGVEVKAMIDAMTVRNIQAGGVGGGDSYVVNQTQQQAVDARDALARALYSNMFDLLVSRINVSLRQQTEGKMRNISILDIFGFEHFQHNHFEQFCINYANEKLQGHFNEFNFSLEIQEYQRENIQWSYDDFYFQTNTKCIELIEAKRTGMLALLDEQCIMPNGNDDTYCTKLKTDIPSHPHLNTGRMRGNRSTLKRYAAEVTYDAEGFCFKNKDPVQPSVVSLMHNSTSQYVQDLFATHWDKMLAANEKGGAPRRGVGAGGSSLIFESVTSQFKRQLADLMLRINAAQPHFVRCINPNNQKTAMLVHSEMILDQLRCSGLMEAVRVSRAGFPVRITHHDFINRFSILIPMAATGDEASTAQRMCQGLRMPPEHFRMGKTKVFMRREINDKLEEERSKLLVKQALTLQRVTRGHLARTYVKHLRKMRGKAAATMQRMVRRMLVRRWYLDMLRKRAELLAQQRAAGGKVDPDLESALTDATVSGSGPPGGRRGGGAGLGSLHGVLGGQSPRFTPGGYQTLVGGQAKAIEDLELNLNSVRELYYNERSSQLALSNLVREIGGMQNPDEIFRKIKQLEDKIATQRREHAINQVGPNVYEDQGLGRRTDSLTACMAILQEKLQYITQAKGGASRDALLALDAARAEIRRKDDEIAMLRGGGGGFGGIDAHSLEVIKQQMMEDRVMLENIIRNERQQREEEFNDMDANVRARDDRIRELEALMGDAPRRLAMKDEELRTKNKQLEELSLLVQTRVNGTAAPPTGGESALHRAYMDLQQQNAKLQSENQRLAAQARALAGGGGGGGAVPDASHIERMETVARQLSACTQTPDIGAIGSGSMKILTTHVIECSDQQRALASSGDSNKLQALSAQRHMLEACRSVITKMAGIGGMTSNGADAYAPRAAYPPGNTGYQQQPMGYPYMQGDDHLGGVRDDDMVLM